MYKNILVFKPVGLLLCWGLLLAACSKMDGTYHSFIDNGEIRYSKKPDSINIFPGYERAEAWMLISEPNIVSCRIYWNDGTDSVVVPVTSSGNDTDTVTAIIDGLTEGSYTFEFVTIDSKGNRSIAADTLANVYGPTYTAELVNRKLYHAALIEGKPHLSWYNASDTTAVAVDILYKDLSGLEHHLLVPNSVLVTRMATAVLGDSLQYRTGFLPHKQAIDTLYSAYQTLHLEPAVVMEVDKSKFAVYALPGDAAAASGYAIANIWDGETFEKGGSLKTDKAGMPHWVTLDMGQRVQLDHYRIWQFGAYSPKYFYANANIEKWEIWGSNDPAADGSWEGWTRLTTNALIKPSGLPVGDNTDEDIEAAVDGTEYRFPEGLPAVRYIRIKVLKTWETYAPGHSFIQEISFFGIPD